MSPAVDPIFAGHDRPWLHHDAPGPTRRRPLRPQHMEYKSALLVGCRKEPKPGRRNRRTVPSPKGRAALRRDHTRVVHDVQVQTSGRFCHCYARRSNCAPCERTPRRKGGLGHGAGSYRSCRWRRGTGKKWRRRALLCLVCEQFEIRLRRSRSSV
jgi:hypothetical protein